MFRNTFSLGGLGLAGAAVLMAAGPVPAAGPFGNHLSIGFNPTQQFAASYGYRPTYGYAGSYGFPGSMRPASFPAPYGYGAATYFPSGFGSNPQFGYRPNWTNGYSPNYGYSNPVGTPYYFAHHPTPEEQGEVPPETPEGKPSTGGRRQPLDFKAHIQVKVPADAEVWFNGQKTTAKGPVREFRSPELDAGYEYSYEVRARWQEGGKERERTRKVSIYPGAHLTVEFPDKPAAGGQAEDKPPR
jgi:uncharacterized protein (TIGR03000 family)